MTKLFALLTVSIAMISVSASAAEETHSYPECEIKKPSKSDETQARASFEEGKKAFEKKRFAEAANYFHSAYEKDCTTSMLLYYAALAFERAEKYPQALVSYQSFLDRSDAPDGTEELVWAEDKVKIIGRMIKHQEEVEKLKAPPPEPKPVSSPIQTAPSGKLLPKTTTTSSVPIALVIGGGAAVVLGTGLYITGALDESSTKAQCANYACPSDDWTEKGNSAQNRKTYGAVLGLSGAATAGAGIIWMLTSGASSERETKPQEGVLPWFSQKGGGLSYKGTF